MFDSSSRIFQFTISIFIRHLFNNAHVIFFDNLVTSVDFIKTLGLIFFA